MHAIPPEYRGWWRIVETSTWGNDRLDDLGTALLSLTGHNDRLRMHYLLAYVNCKATKTGVSFTWKGVWEFDRMSGTGRVRIGEDGKLWGTIKIRKGDDSTFIAELTEKPPRPISKPSYRNKWRR